MISSIAERDVNFVTRLSEQDTDISFNFCDNSSITFENFSLSIKEGETTCILGESGSGKTTLLNILANLTDYEGEVTNVKCSYVFQTPNLFPNLTVLDNLKLVCQDENEIKSVCEKLKIADKLLSYPKHLSGGQRQRVSLARGVLFNADVLLMDEPFSSLDLKNKVQAINLLKELFKEKKKTVVFVTHGVFEAVRLADRIIVLENNSIVYDNSKVNEKTEKELFGLMLKD